MRVPRWISWTVLVLLAAGLAELAFLGGYFALDGQWRSAGSCAALAGVLLFSIIGPRTPLLGPLELHRKPRVVKVFWRSGMVLLAAGILLIAGDAILRLMHGTWKSGLLTVGMVLFFALYAWSKVYLDEPAPEAKEPSPPQGPSP